MIITYNWLRDKFSDFNREYFQDKIPTPRFSLTTNDPNKLGCFSLRHTKYDTRNGRIIGAIHPINATLSVSGYFERDEKAFEETLLHEMIHAYIYMVNGIVPLGDSHGAKFRNWAQKINSDSNGYYNISETGDLRSDSRDGLSNEKGSEQVGKQGNANGRETGQNSSSILCIITDPNNDNKGNSYYWACRVDPENIEAYKNKILQLRPHKVNVKATFYNFTGGGRLNELPCDINNLYGYGADSLMSLKQKLVEELGGDYSTAHMTKINV